MKVLTGNQERLFAAMVPGEWITAKALADRAEIPRRAAGQALVGLHARGAVEYRVTGKAPSSRSDAPPREWKRLGRS